MDQPTRPLTEPPTKRGLRRRLLRHYLPLTLGSAVVLLLFMTLPRFDSSEYSLGDIFSGTFPEDFPAGQSGPRCRRSAGGMFVCVLRTAHRCASTTSSSRAPAHKAPLR